MTAPSRLAFGRFVLTPAQRTLLCDGEPVAMGSRAFDLLTVLAENAGEVVSKDVLMGRVWPRVVVDEGSLRVHMAQLRKALREEQTGERHIANVPRRGYCLVTPVAAGSHERGRPADMAGFALDVPVPPGPLIGREDAIRSACHTLRHRRFLTVAGPGGIGKTSVAVATAERLRLEQSLQPCFLDLSRLRPEDVPDAVRGALGTEAQLRPRTEKAALLLVLDNCEHVVDAAAAAAEDALRRNPGLSVLATSRESLRARGERVQRLQPLALPPIGGAISFGQGLAYAAFELFVERAATGQLSFAEADVETICQLCHRLDGNPLAIELAAGQAGFFGLSGLLRQIETAGDVPAAGWRNAEPRHQSMTQSLRWSFDLLPAPERRMLVRLAALRAPFSLAEAVSLPEENGSRNPVQLLMSLVDKSLVWASLDEGCASYRMCAATRTFAAAQAN